jgi:heme exporter protein A
MKQRMKYASAILHEPEILLLDEPMSNLDENGKAIAEEIITEQKKKGILIVATNETGEYKYSDKMVKLGNGKWKMKNGEI